ncbi:hypothetical protein ACFL5B_03230 [Candidatus Latescibacterota bacterium]
MAAQNVDFMYLKRWLFSIRLQHVVVLAGIIFGFYLLSNLSGLRSDVDRTDYKAVGKHFVTTNATIANKLGKVISVSHVGAGGSAGKESYNVYNLKGEVVPGIGVKKEDIGKKRTGVCFVTLMKDEGLWYVKSASLTMAGAEHTIPVRRTNEKRKIKVF